MGVDLRRDILPVQINEDYKLGEAVEWAYDDDEAFHATCL